MQSVSQFIERVSSPFLRLSLGVTFIWFGILHMLNQTAALSLLHITVFSFLAARVFVYILGTLEIVSGLLFVLGLWVRYVSLLSILILIGPLVIFLTSPAIIGFPLLNVFGEFLLKDFVLVGAALSIAATDFAKQKQVAGVKPAHSA